MAVEEVPSSTCSNRREPRRPRLDRAKSRPAFAGCRLEAAGEARGGSAQNRSPICPGAPRSNGSYPTAACMVEGGDQRVGDPEARPRHARRVPLSPGRFAPIFPKGSAVCPRHQQDASDWHAFPGAASVIGQSSSAYAAISSASCPMICSRRGGGGTAARTAQGCPPQEGCPRSGAPKSDTLPHRCRTPVVSGAATPRLPCRSPIGGSARRTGTRRARSAWLRRGRSRR